TPGQTSVHATTTVTVNGVSLTRATGDTNGGDSADAVKKWVDANIAISPLTASNEIGTNHVLTITVKTNDGSGTGYVLAGGKLVTASLTNSNGGTAAFVGSNTCTTGTTGTALATPTLPTTSPTPGQTSVHATTTVTVNGV